MVLCTSCPSICMAAAGLAGQRFSHAPHPMHFSSLSAGIRGESLSSGYFLTILIAPVGQCLAQFPHFTLSVLTTHASGSITACPICMDDFSSIVTGSMAPAGQTSEHLVHSGLQYPFS